MKKNMVEHASESVYVGRLFQCSVKFYDMTLKQGHSRALISWWGGGGEEGSVLIEQRTLIIKHKKKKKKTTVLFTIGR